MLKPLTAEGRFECGLDEAVAKKPDWCFVAVMGEHCGARLGIAIANEQGYWPIPEYWANADTLPELQAHADELNKAEGLTLQDAMLIQVSTMGGRRYVRRDGEALA